MCYVTECYKPVIGAKYRYGSVCCDDHYPSYYKVSDVDYNKVKSFNGSISLYHCKRCLTKLTFGFIPPDASFSGNYGYCSEHGGFTMDSHTFEVIHNYWKNNSKINQSETETNKFLSNVGQFLQKLRRTPNKYELDVISANLDISNPESLNFTLPVLQDSCKDAPTTLQDNPTNVLSNQLKLEARQVAIQKVINAALTQSKIGFPKTLVKFGLIPKSAGKTITDFLKTEQGTAIWNLVISILATMAPKLNVPEKYINLQEQIVAEIRKATMGSGIDVLGILFSGAFEKLFNDVLIHETAQEKPKQAKVIPPKRTCTAHKTTINQDSPVYQTINS